MSAPKKSVFGRQSKCLISKCFGKEVTLKSKCLEKAYVLKKADISSYLYNPESWFNRLINLRDQRESGLLLDSKWVMRNDSTIRRKIGE